MCPGEDGRGEAADDQGAAGGAASGGGAPGAAEEAASEPDAEGERGSKGQPSEPSLHAKVLNVPRPGPPCGPIYKSPCACRSNGAVHNTWRVY